MFRLIFIKVRDKQYIDISGKTFGNLTALEYTRTLEKRSYWKCKCNCGKVVEIRGKELKSGGVKSCGCLKSQYKIPLRNDIINKKYNFLLVVCREKNGKKGVWYRCKCDCGNEAVIASDKIISGHTKSCGCLHIKTAREMAVERNKKMVGENHPRWRDDITEEERESQKENRCGTDPKRVRWKTKIYERDNYKCKKCGYDEGRILVAHHIYSWNSHKKLRYVSNNGVTLCGTCHKDFHKNYGYGNNTRKQLTQWIKSTNI